MLLNEELQTNYTISETYGNKIALILVAKANTEKIFTLMVYGNICCMMLPTQLK